MHELGIVFAMIDTLEDVARDNDLTVISRVTLELGEVSGVIPDYLLDCWKWASDKHDLLRGAELAIETIPAVTICNACGKTYPTVEYGRTCPYCGSGETVLQQGNEFQIRDVTAC